MASRLLGSGRGIDHVMIAVRNLQQAMDNYALLGFDVHRGGKHPGGTENAVARFERRDYLELLGVYDPNASGGREILGILEKGEGGVGIGLETSSAAETASQLRTGGLDVVGPTKGTIKPDGTDETPPALWETVTIGSPSPYFGDVAFFTQYHHEAWEELQRVNPALGQRRLPGSHSNGALGIASVWLAVDSLDQAAAVWGSIGFSIGPVTELPYLHSRGCRVGIGTGNILLLQPVGPETPPGRFLTQRGLKAGVLGVSLEVPDLAVSRENLHLSLTPEVHLRRSEIGKGILIGPDLADGLSIELCESHRAS